MSVHFTSDTHFGHEMVAKLRGFDTAADHDQAIRDNLAAVMRKPDDQLWILGDLALSQWRHALAIIGSLPGSKHLIIGNHDQVFPGLVRDSHKHFRAYMEVFDSVQMVARRKIAGKTVFLSHVPYAADHTAEPRWGRYRVPDLGDWLIHGHTHSTQWREGPREIHVGLDAWGLEPVPLSMIEHIVAGSTERPTVTATSAGEPTP